MIRQLRPLALAFALSLAVGPAPAQSGTSDLAQLEHYTLSMDLLTRYFESLKDLAPVAKADPSLQDSLATDADKHESLAQIETRISSHPALTSVITRHGFTVHTFVLTQVTMIQAAMAAAFKPAGENSAGYAAKVHVNPANLDFIEQHKADLEALQKKYAGSESSE